MHPFDPPPPPKPRHREFAVWAVCVALLVVPAALAWIVRGSAYAMSCDPTPALCHGLALGGGLRDALDLSWFIALNPLVCIVLSLIASLALLKARRPLVAALTMLLLPVVALGLPAFAVYTVTSADCMPNEEAVGECVLWATKMGMSAHNGIKAEYAVFDLAPYIFSLALMAGVVGFFFFRPRPR